MLPRRCCSRMGWDGVGWEGSGREGMGWLFYVFLESVLIPMFLIIGVWGSRERKEACNGVGVMVAGGGAVDAICWSRPLQ